MRPRLAAIALVTVAAAGCSGGSSGPAPAPTATPAPTYTQLGTLAIGRVSGVRHFPDGDDCSSAVATYPHGYLKPGFRVVCDPHDRLVMLLAKPALDQTAVEATTVARAPGGRSWTVYIQLSKSGARAFGQIGGRYAIAYNGVVVETAPTATPGGFVQIAGLSKHKAKHIAAALNPS